MTNGTDPAFPLDPDKQKYQKAGMGWLLGGLTKREYFAAMAMQGIIKTVQGVSVGIVTIPEPGPMAEIALKIADALIAELNKEKP